MFEKFFKTLIIDAMGTYVEDFTEQDIQIDNWNGVIVKENAVIKKTALESIMRSVVGAPVYVKTGFCRKIRINIPWSEIMSKPVEIFLDDIHGICHTPPGFNKEFAKKAYHKAKMNQFDELLKQFKDQYKKESDLQKDEEISLSYYGRLKSMILQNLRLCINNLHIRFEDTQVSRVEKSFNFAILIDQLQYSYTNNRFERVFINIDDKKKENRSFKMLEIKQLAMYWNTNVGENWTQNSEFVNLDCLKTIDFSKKYVDNLKRKYHQYQQNYNQNQVYIIQPFNLTVKWRTNLNQKAQPYIPHSTDNYEISQLLITIDEEIYKDIQYLMKFWSWHSTAVKKQIGHLQFRPAFNEPVKGNQRKFWKYAIKSTIYYLRKAKRNSTGYYKQKRQRQMIELSELYKIKKFNKWLKDNVNSENLIMTVNLPSLDLKYNLKDMLALESKIFKHECKLTPEQLVVAYTKAEKEAEEMIEEEKKRLGWTNWISSSVMSFMGYGAQKEESKHKNEEEDIQQIMKKIEEFDNFSETSSTIHEYTGKQENMILSDHLALNIPIIQFSLVNKSMHQYGSKQFMMIVIQDLFLQQIASKKDNFSQILFSIKNFEIVDRLLNQQKFSRLVQKKEQPQHQEKQLSRSISQNARLQYQKQKAYLQDQESLSEIEEEMNPNINNGMQQIQDYNRMKSSLEMNQQYFLVLQLTNQVQKRQNVNVKCYNLDMIITNMQIFYNRVLISRTQSFINQARINKVQNAQAEEDFDNKLEKFKQETEMKVNNILEKSEIHLNCNLKSVEILAPDNINYEMSKFLILQTGDIHLRSGESKRLGLYFNPNNQIDQQIGYQFKQKIQEQETQGEQNGVYIDEKTLDLSQLDKYSFMIYDLKILYIPTVDQLENFMYNDTQQTDIDQKLTILQKMDIVVEYHSCISSTYNHIKAGIGSVSIKLTNKEIQQLKDFIDNIQKYHDQISYEIKRELKQIYKFNFGNAFLERIQNVNQKPNVKAMIADVVGNIRRKKTKQQLDESFHSMGGNDEFESDNEPKETDEGDEFHDAQDYFDPGIVDQVERLRNKQIDEFDEYDEFIEKVEKHNTKSQKSKKCMTVSVCMPRFKMSILEAQDLEKELLRDIKEKIGGQFTRREQLIELDLKIKGLPFLELEFSRINVRHFQNSQMQVLAFFMQDISLVNLEKKRDPKNIFISSNNDIYQHYMSGHMKKSFDERDPDSSLKSRLKPKSRMMGPEEEEMIQEDNYSNNMPGLDQIEQFIEVFIIKTPQLNKISIQLGQSDFELNDSLIRKVYEIIIKDIPESSVSKYREAQNKLDQQVALKEEKTPSNLQFRWIGINAILRDKKDFLLLKLVEIKLKVNNEGPKDSIELRVRDFQIIQDDFEILMKYHNSSMQTVVSSRNQLIDPNSDNEEDFQTDLLMFEQVTVPDISHSQTITISSFLFVFDFKRLLTLLSIQKSFDSQFSNIPTKKREKIPKVYSETSLEISIFESYLQLPSKEDKNSLFLVIEELNLKKTKEVLKVQDKLIQIFVAHQFDQNERYNLLSVKNTNIDGLNGSYKVQNQEIKVTLNENYILLLSKLVDENYTEIGQIIPKLKKHENNEESPQPIEVIQEQKSSHQIFESQEITQLILLSENSNAPIQFLLLDSFKIEWIFGQTFDDHQDKFVTLNNRNFTKMILEKFDNQAKIERKMSDISENDDVVDEQIDSGMPKIIKQKSQTNYQKLITEFKAINFQQIKGVKLLKVSDIRIDYLNSNDYLFPIVHIHHEPFAIEFLFTKDLSLKIGHFDLKICQQNAQIISCLTKSIYSCKNAVYKGRILQLVKQFTSEKPKANVAREQEQIDKITRIEIGNFRVIIFDSSTMEKEGQKKSIFDNLDKVGGFGRSQSFHISEDLGTSLLSPLGDREMNSHLKQHVLSSDSITARSAFLINFSIQGVVTRNPNFIKSQYDQDVFDLGLDKIQVVKIKSLEIYQNSFATTLQELSGPMAKSVILHPTNILLKTASYLQEQFYPSKNIQEIEVSTTEFEFSVKQIFKLKLLHEKISEKLVPISQIIDHLDKKKGKVQETRHKQLSITLSSLYITLINEISDSEQFAPIISLESKEISFSSTKIPEKQIDKLRLIVPFEVYYFNQNLNFFEPLVEQTKIELVIDKNSGQKITKIELQELLNVNFSVALYDQLFNFTSIIKNEQQNYEQSIEQQPRRKPKNQYQAASYFIKNSTGEILMFKTINQKAFNEIQPDEEYPLDFQPFEKQFKSEPVKKKKQNKDILSQLQTQKFDSESEFSSEEENPENEDFGLLSIVPARSIFRRKNYKFMKSEPKKVQFQVLIQYGSEIERTSIFELNIESLSCQRFYLDDQKQFYLICQTQQADGQKHLIVRSPMQINNNLQIPLEIILQNKMSPMLENSGDEIIKSEYQFLGQPVQYEMLVKPESSTVIPLRACGFNQVQMRPIHNLKKNASALNRGDKKFEWTQKATISLQIEESEIFEQQPVILESKMLRKNTSVERNNNKVFMVVNSNIYSIRSYVDFNTQQTEFISMRYLSISPPFIFQNLIPAPITLFFKNIMRKIMNNDEFQDPQLYDLDLKHNSQLQILFLNPLGNFDLSLVIPGYDQTNFVSFKENKDEDFKICEDLKKQNYLNALFSEEENQMPVKDSKFRFIKQKKMLFQLVSQFQNQFNICANIAFIQGQYQMTFYSKYWLLNNTLMPLEVQISTQTYKFEQMNLPYENQDFDFETIRKFEEPQESEQKPRKNSNDSIVTSSKKEETTHQSQVDYKQLINRQRTQLNERTQFGRIKPWEGYKFQQNDNLGLLGILSQQDIDSVQVVYFTQEEYKEENKSETTAQHDDKISQGTSQKEQRLHQALKRSSMNFAAVDQQSMISKTSIQMVKFQELMDSQEAVPLIHTELSNTEIYSAPLQDKAQLKRVILFSDNPQDESEQLQLQQQQRQKNMESLAPHSKKEFLKSISQNIQDDIKTICLKICDSDWTELPFDVTKLQGESILLNDRSRKYCTNSMYEIVANVQYLPNPFSFSKIIEFKPRYMLINRTYMTIQIIQAECEEKGLFKVYPFETSNFHWTDGQKPLEINVKVEEHEYSGNVRIDGIGEINLRLRGIYDNQSIILNVSITEERNSLFIIFNDASYAPPYRIENLTKTSFKITQVGSRTNDFDILKPYQIIPYAWSYPLNEKLLKISISSSSNDEDLGSFKIDQINKSEKIILEDKKTGRQFLLEILNEKAFKVIRISYTDEYTKNELINNLQDNQIVANQQTVKLQLIFRKLGISIINSQARELAYVFIKHLKISTEKQANNNKFSLKAQDIQIDNQLVRKSDEIILKRDPESGSVESNKYMINLKVQYITNDTIQNLHFFRYFYLMIVPFNLNLDGNFCDEMFRYGQDILQQTKKYQAYDRSKKLEFFDKENDIDKIKKAFTDLKHQNGREIQAQKKIYFEEFYVHEIKMKFTFNSSPIMFREFTMNPTLKFLIVLMSNLQKVQLKFAALQIHQQQQLMPIFFAQVKRHYLQQCYNHQQILKLISSMGLFGNISESLNNMTNAIESLMYHPMYEDSFFKGVAIGGAIFVKYSISAITGPVKSVFESFKSGVMFLFQIGMQNAQSSEDEQGLMSIHERNMLDDDIEQVSKGINNFGTPLNAIDTQNRIWLKIITKEKISQDVKRQFLMKQQNLGIRQKAIPAEQMSKNFYKRHDNPGMVEISRQAFSKLLYVPKRIITSSAQVIDNMNTRLIEEQMKLQAHKIRPPRFTSFTMQLEPYSLKKAYALEILNDINLNLFQTETIQKMITMGKYVIIFTAKRIICVEEIINQEAYQNQQKMRKNSELQEHQPNDLSYERISSSTYKHWNIYFDDILKVKLDMAQYAGVNAMTGEPLLKSISPDTQAQLFNSDDSYRSNKMTIIFSLKILFTEALEEDSLSDFRLSSKDINVYWRDIGQLKNVYKEVYNRSKQNVM